MVPPAPMCTTRCISVIDWMSAHPEEVSPLGQAGSQPIVLISAGIGVTPLLAMLHTLVARRSQREGWWFYSARNSAEHAFSQESRKLLRALPHSHSHVLYSRPGSKDRPGLDFDITERLTAATLKELGVPEDAEFLSLRSTSFSPRFDRWFNEPGHRSGTHPYRDIRSGHIQYIGTGEQNLSTTTSTGQSSRGRSPGFVRT